MWDMVQYRNIQHKTLNVDHRGQGHVVIFREFESLGHSMVKGMFNDNR
jgi:hypothetical protein